MLKRKRVEWFRTEQLAFGLILGRLAGSKLANSGGWVLCLGLGRRELDLRLTWGGAK